MPNGLGNRARSEGAIFFGTTALVALIIAAAVYGYVSQSRTSILLLTAIGLILALLTGILLLRLGQRRLTVREHAAELERHRELMERLEESEERHRSLFENMLSPVLIIQDFRIVYANQKFYSLAGYSPEEISDDDFDLMSLIHEDDRELAASNMSRRLQGEDADDPHEMRYVRKDGDTLIALTFSSLVYFQGKPAIETVLADITPLKKMETELSRTKERMQYLLDNAPVMIFALDREARFAYANAETLRATGYGRDEWIGKPFAPIVHPDDLQLAIQKFEEGRKGLPRREYKLRIKTATGELRVLHIVAGTIIDDDQHGGSLIIARDITEQQRLEEHLDRERQFIDRLIENANAMIGVLDDEGKLVIFNRRFEQVSGLRKEEALGRKLCSTFIPEESRRLVLDAVDKTRQGERVLEREIAFRSKSGVPLVGTWSAAAVKLPSGRNGVVFVGHDVTQQKRMHEELAQSKKLASIGEMISGVAHELNNPLTVVIGYSQLLTAAEMLSDRHHDMAQHILDAAMRSKRVVENLLAFARKKTLEKNEVDINETIETMLSLRERNLNACNVQIVRDYEKDLPGVLADKNQLQQVFLNLINNAFDSMYALREGGTLEVKTRMDATRVIVSIADSGPGIPAEIEDKVFDPFFTTKEVGQGTGLGMSVSYGIVKEHGGNIYLDKTYRDGARFVVELPLLPSAWRTVARQT